MLCGTSNPTCVVPQGDKLNIVQLVVWTHGPDLCFYSWRRMRKRKVAWQVWGRAGSPEGLRLLHRSCSLSWKGKHTHVIYNTDIMRCRRRREKTFECVSLCVFVYYFLTNRPGHLKPLTHACLITSACCGRVCATSWVLTSQKETSSRVRNQALWWTTAESSGWRKRRSPPPGSWDTHTHTRVQKTTNATTITWVATCHVWVCE